MGRERGEERGEEKGDGREREGRGEEKGERRGERGWAGWERERGESVPCRLGVELDECSDSGTDPGPCLPPGALSVQMPRRLWGCCCWLPDEIDSDEKSRPLPSLVGCCCTIFDI